MTCPMAMPCLAGAPTCPTCIRASGARPALVVDNEERGTADVQQANEIVQKAVNEVKASWESGGTTPVEPKGPVKTAGPRPLMEGLDVSRAVKGTLRGLVGSGLSDDALRSDGPAETRNAGQAPSTTHWGPPCGECGYAYIGHLTTCSKYPKPADSSRQALSFETIREACAVVADCAAADEVAGPCREIAESIARRIRCIVQMAAPGSGNDEGPR